MRKRDFLLILVLFQAFSLEAKNIEGTIITRSDTLQAIFRIPVKIFTGEPNFEKIQFKLKYIDSTGNRKVLRPENVNEIRFSYNYEEIRMLSRFNAVGLGNIFTTGSHVLLKLEVDGPVKLFRYYYTQRTSGTYNSTTGSWNGGVAYEAERFILQMEDEPITRPRSFGFKKDMKEFFRNCPSLVEKIESNEYQRDLYLIVKYYNTACR